MLQCATMHSGARTAFDCAALLDAPARSLELPESSGGLARRVSEVLAPASIFNFCGAHDCNAFCDPLVRPFHHHQSALTPIFFRVIAATPACAPVLPESLGGSARRVSEVLAPASIFNFCGAHVCNAHSVTPWCAHSCIFSHHQSALTPTFCSHHCWQLWHVHPSSLSHSPRCCGD